MKVLYHIPYLNTRYAGRSIIMGYMHAFEELGHSFQILTSESNAPEVFETYKPDILIFSLNRYSVKFLDVSWIIEYKKRNKNLQVYAWIPFWKSPLSKLRINESSGLSDMADLKTLLNNGFVDHCFAQSEVGNPNMEGFEKSTGFVYNSIPLAADTYYMHSTFQDRFKADISFIGTLLPEKKEFIENQVLPMRKKYDLKLYGQDWTKVEKIISFAKKVGQYFNLPIIKDIQKASLELEDEASIYKSSLISINVHEEYQKKFGKDCNERTFKIPLYGGFEITDDVAIIRDYFIEDKEIIIGKNKDDWFDKIDYYIKNPDKRLAVMDAGMKRVLKDHTYINRSNKILELYHARK